MKKEIIKFLIAGLIMLGLFTSCEEDDPAYPDSAILKLSASTLTVLDSELQTTIDFVTATKTVTDVSILLDDTELYSAQASGNKATFTLLRSDLGLNEDGDAVTIYVHATVDGKVKEMYTTIDMESAMSIEAPTVYENSDMEYFYFNASPISATVSGVMVQTKINSGTYSDVAGTFNANDSIEITGTDFNLGDTVYMKVTATAGSRSESIEASTVVGMYSYANTESIRLDTADLAYDFIEMRYMDPVVAGDSADIEFSYTSITGGYTLGFVSNQNAEFVVATADDYETADINVIEATDFSSPVTSDDDVAVGDVYIYRTKRTADVDYTYGIMKVINVDKPQGILDDSYIEIEFKY